MEDLTPDPTVEWDEAQKQEIVEAIKHIRTSKKNAKIVVHGFRIEWTLRDKRHSSMRGDLVMIDPRDGQKLFSVVSVQRKLGLVAPVEPSTRPTNTEATDGTTETRRVHNPLAPVDTTMERSSRSTRAVVNYAELSSAAPRLPDLVLQTLAARLEDGQHGADLVDLVNGVHLRGEYMDGHVRPYSQVQRTVNNMLRQGALRRQLVTSTAKLKGDTSNGDGGSSSSSSSAEVERALAVLVMSTLQVEPEAEGTPWRLARVRAEGEKGEEEEGGKGGNGGGASDEHASKKEDSVSVVDDEGNESDEGDDAANSIGEVSAAAVDAALAAELEMDEETGQPVPTLDKAPDAVDGEAQAATHGTVKSEALDGGASGEDGSGAHTEYGCVLVKVKGLFEHPGPWPIQSSVGSEDEDEYGASEDDHEDGAYVASEEEEDDDESADEYVDDSADEDFVYIRGGGAKRPRGATGGDRGGKKRGRPRGGSGAPAIDPGDMRPQVERLLSLAHIKERLPVNHDATMFGCPEGWSERKLDEGRRRPKKVWVRHGGGGGGNVEAGQQQEEEEETCERRYDLEHLLEQEAQSRGVVYLGQLYGGEWQISSKAMGDALLHVLGGLVRRGLVREVPPRQSGKVGAMWMICNHYERGEPFPKAEGTGRAGRRGAKAEEDEEEEEQLADIEKERLRNIERNKEILRQLGLA